MLFTINFLSLSFLCKKYSITSITSIQYNFNIFIIVCLLLFITIHNCPVILDNHAFPFFLNFFSIMPGNYYFLVGSLSFLAGLYVDQNYNVPDIKYWVKHTEDIVN